MLPSTVRHTGAVVVAAIVLGGCSSTNRVAGWSEPVAPSATVSLEGVDLDSSIDEWLGTPHLLGGQDKDGVDCSAFVRAVVLDAYNVQLPRTAAEQLHSGHRVNGPTSAGNLVFFRNDDGDLHVGLALNSDEFAHASASRGVVIDRIDSSYWSDRLFRQRRIATEAGATMGSSGW